MEAKIAMMQRYLDASMNYLGEKKACYMMRSRLGWFAKGLPQASQFRHGIRHIDSKAKADALIAVYAANLSSGCKN